MVLWSENIYFFLLVDQVSRLYTARAIFAFTTVHGGILRHQLGGHLYTAWERRLWQLPAPHSSYYSGGILRQQLGGHLYTA